MSLIHLRRPQPLAALCGLALLALTGCGGGGGAVAPVTRFDAAAILAHYAQNIVLSAYTSLNTAALDLETAVTAYLANPTPATLATAQQAWVTAREPWENSEAFLFGPVTNLGLDPALDSWPVNRTDLDSVLASATPLTAATVASFDDTLRGFHTVEYILFDDGGGSKDPALIIAATQASPRRQAYLAAATADLTNNATRLFDAWRSGDGNFVNEFLTAGTGSVIYPSQRAAMQEIVEGIKTISDEVANGKINDPVSQQDGTLEESQFSDNSLADFIDDIRGVQAAYLGTYTGTASASGFTAYVAARDATLDAQIKAELQGALDALAAIPAPFRTAIFDPAAADEIAAAQDAINQVFDTMEAEVTPLIDATSFLH